jgi:hypothetical protein
MVMNAGTFSLTTFFVRVIHSIAFELLETLVLITT